MDDISNPPKMLPYDLFTVGDAILVACFAEPNDTVKRQTIEIGRFSDVQEAEEIVEDLRGLRQRGRIGLAVVAARFKHVPPDLALG